MIHFGAWSVSGALRTPLRAAEELKNSLEVVTGWTLATSMPWGASSKRIARQTDSCAAFVAA